MLFSLLANHQSRHQATDKMGCQLSDCINSLGFSSGLCGYACVNILTLSPLRVLFTWVFGHFHKGKKKSQNKKCTWYILGLKRVLGYSDSGRCQTSARYCRPTRVLGIYNDGRKLYCKVACGDYFKAYLTSVDITVTMWYVLKVLWAYVLY